MQYVTDGRAVERASGQAFEDRVLYAAAPTTVDVMTGEIRSKAVAIETQGVQSVASAPFEMQAVAEMNSRLRTAADVHMVLSWREGERPASDQAFEAGRHVLGALGMREHQYVMAVHDDTANTHVHIVANRVHPETFKAVDLYRNYETFDRACREIELAQGWTPELSARSLHVVNHGRIERVYRDRDPDAPAPLGSRGDTARAHSDQSIFTEWVRAAAPELKAYLATSTVTWAGVHARLAEFNLRIEPKNAGTTAGFVVIDRDDPTRVAQAGQIAHFMRRGKLEAVLGPFEPDQFRALSDARGIDAPADFTSAAPIVDSVAGDDSSDSPKPEPPAQASAKLHGYARYLVDDDNRRRAARGLEVTGDPQILIDELTQRSATITTDDLRRAIEHDVASPEQALQVWRGIAELVEQGALLPLTDPSPGAASPVRWTTPAILAREAAFVAAVDALGCMRRQATEINPDRLHAAGFNTAQRAAAVRMLGTETIVPIIGHAGSGKSYVFAKTFELIRDGEPERRQIGIAQGGQAAAELQAATQIPAMTIAAFTRGVRAGTIAVDQHTDVVLDEANLVGTYEMHDVVSIVQEAGARLFVAGDGSQLPAVAAGGAFDLLTRRVEPTALDEVVRQTGWKRDASDFARRGDSVAAAIKLYAEHGSLHVAATTAEAIEDAVDRWLARPEPFASKLLVAFRNDDVAALNAEAHARIQQSEPDAEHIVVRTKRYAELEIGVGERVIFRANDYALNVRNGMLGTVTAMDRGELKVRIDGTTRDVVVAPATYDDFGYGYAIGTYAAEGKTANYCLTYASRADFQGSLYVGLSRSRGDSDIVIAEDEFRFNRPRPQDAVVNLTFIAQRERAKDLASDYERAAQAQLDVDAARIAAGRYTMRPAPDEGTASIRRNPAQRQFQSWLSTEVGTDLRIVLEDPSATWSRYHAVLAANGVTAERTARGLIYADDTDDRWRCKASTLPRRYHLAALEAVFGPFEAGDVSPLERQYAESLRDHREAAADVGRARANSTHTYARDRDRAEHVRASQDPAYDRFTSNRAQRGDRTDAWASQRGSEQGRHTSITAGKRDLRERLLQRGYKARAATSIAAAWAFEQREALHATIRDERDSLRATMEPIRVESWRQFMDRHTTSELENPRNDREQPRAFAEDQQANAPRRDGPTIESVHAHTPDQRETPGLRHRVHENGDVGYRYSDLQSRVFGKDIFVDRGQRVTLEDGSARAIAAAVGYAREKFGDEAVTLRVRPEQLNAILRQAVQARLNIANPEMQSRIETIKRETKARTVRCDIGTRRERGFSGPDRER